MSYLLGQKSFNSYEVLTSSEAQIRKHPVMRFRPPSLRHGGQIRPLAVLLVNNSRAPNGCLLILRVKAEYLNITLYTA